MKTELFPPLPGPILENVLPLIEKTFPVPGRFRGELTGDVAELSRLLTSARNERSLSYLNRPPLLSAYLRYFLPWNLYRLCRLLPGLDLSLAPGDTVADLGSGPLTLPAALWISRPELRSLPLEFRCIDRSAAVLEAGRRFFTALAGENSPWTIKTLTGEVRPGPARPLSVELKGKAPALIAAVYLYNEICQPLPPEDTGALDRLAGNQAAFLAGLGGEGARILILEPGVPRSGEFISLLRASFLRLGCPPLSPCLHPGPCPLEKGKSPGGKRAAKWCHFAFDTGDAPRALRNLSAAAGIPKERATLSFLLVEKKTAGRAAFASAADAAPAVQDATAPISLRLLSDTFPLPAGGRGAYGRYGCGEQGLVLVRGGRQRLEDLRSGALVWVKLSAGRDLKSGAMIAEAE
ncbi:MAG: rRNA methyltransferase [Treponema sp.]|jgi:hypothetical protein|nr:rRNA methyltransferase [Treponema sp.]